jgi:uncharacterized lipoprotein YajG
MKPAPKIFCSDKSLNFHGLFVLAVIFLISACATPPKQSGVTTTGSAHPKVASARNTGIGMEPGIAWGGPAAGESTVPVL